MSKEAIKHVHEKFAIQKVAEKYIELLKRTQVETTERMGWMAHD